MMKARLWCTLCNAPVVSTNPAEEAAVAFPRDGEGWGVFEVECLDDGTCPAMEWLVGDDEDVHVAEGWVLRIRDDAESVWIADVKLSDDTISVRHP